MNNSKNMTAQAALGLIVSGIQVIIQILYLMSCDGKFSTSTVEAIRRERDWFIEEFNNR